MRKGKSKSQGDCQGSQGFLPIDSLEVCYLPPAYYEGAESAEENKGSEENPYRLGTVAHNVWAMGFADGLEENPHFGPILQEGGGL